MIVWLVSMKACVLCIFKWCVMFDYVVKWNTFIFHNNNNNNITWCYNLFAFTFIIYNQIM